MIRCIMIYDMIYYDMIYRLHKNSSFIEAFVSKHIVADVTTPQI